MNKSDLIERVADEAGMTKQVTGIAVEGVFSATAEGLARGEDVTVVGFGKFSTTSRPARTGRNPRTGEPVPVGPSTTVSFKAGKALKEALN
ncbi:MAG: HU family DNA-binding protein [Rhodospirillaceae bacterium]|nr:HU family DNA-binding protein [Rhodospirillaceae bacterium]MDE0617110.1 HU family DNA-binding protein [Rhodospirillaceae bacterium]